MAWNDGVTRATGDLILAADWNAYLGATGSLMQLKSHAHGGTTGEGSQSLGPLVLEDFTDAAAPAAPGAGKTRLYATSGRVRFRDGAAGTDKLVAKNPMTAQGDLIYGGASGDETRLGAGTDGQFLKTRGSGANPEWANPSVAHSATTGQTADDHHKRTEAKVTAGSAEEESVTWTTAFAATPVVVCTGEDATAGSDIICTLVSRSTTGATARTASDAGSAQNRVKLLVAQEAT